MKKKLALILAGVIVIGSLGIGMFMKNKKQNNKLQETTGSVKKDKKINENIDLYVRYAFADVDMDQIIQEVDPKDDDLKADYIFIRFSAPIIQNKDENNLGNIKNYKLDGKELPKTAQVLLRKDIAGNLIIKLPQGYLKGKNNGHTLEILKTVVNGKKQIIGDTKLNLPYSKPENKKLNDKNNKVENKNNKNTNKKDNLGKNKNEVVKPKDINKNMPKFTVEIGKGIPYITIVLVKLQIPKVEDFKVSIDNVQLKIRENNKKQKVFVGSVKKDYSYDQVISRIKIEKAK